MNYCSDISLIRITVLVFIILFVFGLLTYSELFKFSRVDDGTTLVMVHVIFRSGKTLLHDDRSLYSEEIPSTASELSNEGKAMMFDLGLEFRKTYSALIDKDYGHKNLGAICVDTKLSKESLMLVLAGLFSSRGSIKWSPALHLQQIPFTTINTSDLLLSSVPKFCSRWNQLYDEVSATEVFTNPLIENARYFDYVSNKTLKPANLFTAFLLDYNIESGLKPPDWLHEIYPQPTKLLVDAYYTSATANDEMKRIVSGSLLSKIINDTIEKIKTNPKRKIHVYSAEDYNLQYLLKTLGVIVSTSTLQGSYIAIEVHKFEGTYFLKFNFGKAAGGKIEILDLPYCGKLCPLRYFIKINKKFQSTTNMCNV